MLIKGISLLKMYESLLLGVLVCIQVIKQNNPDNIHDKLLYLFMALYVF